MRILLRKYIAKFLSAPLLLALLSIAFSSSKSLGDDHLEIPFETIHQSDSYLSEATTEIVGTTEEWRHLWEAHRAGFLPPPALPQINFAESTVVAVTSGWRPTTGYQIEIKRIKRSASDSSHLFVTYASTGRPGRAQVFTHPSHIVKIPIVAATASFRDIVANPPVMVRATDNGSATLRIPSKQGFDYQIYVSSDLIEWNLLTTLEGTGGMLELIPESGDRARFFRVE